MSEMTDEEYDYTRIEKGLCSERTLKILKEKYKDKPYIIKRINAKLEELEDEYDR